MKNKRIFIAPLNWGLGHATRCIPIIHRLNELGNEVIIGADGDILQLLQKEFPKNAFIPFPGYNISYPKNGNMTLHFLKLLPNIIRTIKSENRYLKQIVEKHQIDGVISDNRFGLYHSSVPCVYITHQLNIQSPFLQKILNFIHHHFIQKYNFCWVPDFKENGLGGALSKSNKKLKNIHFINPLSRFKDIKLENHTTIKWDVLAIVSGPEPQRSLFENILTEQLSKYNGKCLLIIGKPADKQTNKQLNNLTIVNHLNSVELAREMNQSSVIISRSGYSTIMDVYYLQKKAIFIPTPAQPEQVYLASYLMKNGCFYSVSQDKLNIELALQEANHYKGFEKKIVDDSFNQAIQVFLAKI
jgi:uncharacterized protein (TIGR00661 family)